MRSTYIYQTAECEDDQSFSTRIMRDNVEGPRGSSNHICQWESDDAETKLLVPRFEG